MRNLYASVLLFSLALIPAAHAQHAFQTLLPGLAPAQKRPAVQTPDGGFCVLAEYIEDGTQNCHFVLLKTTVDGAVEWARRLSTFGMNDRPIALRGTPDGGFLAVGITSVPDSWNQNILVAKTNAHGYPVWSRTYDYSTLDWASDFTLLEDGSAIIVGSTTITDSAAALAIIQEEELEASVADDTYGAYTAERTFILRIDPDGEILWGGYLMESSPDPGGNPVTKAFAQAVCRRTSNSVTLVEQAAYDYAFSSGIVVNLTDEGTASSGLRMESQGTDAEPLVAQFANDIAPLPDGSCMVAGLTRYYSPSLTGVDEGFLLRLDERNKVLWNRTYTSGPGPFPLTIAPIDKDRFLIAGRTLYTDGYDGDLDNPVVAITDSDGKVNEAVEWTTSFQGLPTRESKDGELKPYLWWPLFIPTDDQGVLSVGSILMRDPYGYYTGISAGVVLTRFNPDLSLCGEDETASAKVISALAGEPREGANMDYPADWIPLDVTSSDYRTYAPGPLGMPADSAMPMISDVAVRDDYDDQHLEEADDYPYRETTDDLVNVEEIEPESYEEHVYGEDSVESELSDESTPGDEEDYYAEDEIHGDDFYDNGEESSTKEGDEETDYDDSDRMAVDRDVYTPVISKVDVALVRLQVESTLLSDVDVDDFEITPLLVCGESPMSGASSAPSKERSVEAEYLHVLPNSIQKGKSVAVEFRMRADRKPEVNLISVGRGEVVGRLNAKSIMWSEADGTGGVTIETAGIAAGVYLVQIRSGERQLSAKLEVR